MWFYRWWRCAGVGAGFALVAALAGGWGAGPPVEAVRGTTAPEPPEAGAATRAPDAEPQVRSPVRRVAATFDFEEEDNPYPVPRHWVRAQDSEKLSRPGYPGYNLGEFDFSVAHSGRASVKLPTRGGSASLRLSSGVIPVFVEGDYAVQAWVRTADIEKSRAFVSARLLDQSSRPLPGTEVRSSPLRTSGEWMEVHLEIVGAPTAAAYLQVELELLQPRQFLSPGPAGEAQVWEEDIWGAAWFDDIVVYQLPRVEITTGAPANIVLMPERPVVQILVRDFVGERLDGHLVVTDLDGVVIADEQLALAATGRAQEWVPKLPALGWYHVTLSVLGERPDGERYRVGGSEMAFLWLQEAGAQAGRAGGAGPRGDRLRFGVVADRAEQDIVRELPSLGRRIGTGFMVVPVWDEGVTKERMVESLREIGVSVDALSKAGQSVVLCVPSIPRGLLEEYQVAEDDPLALAEIESQKWMPFLQPVLDRYGQRLTRWQVGRAGTDAVFWRQGVLASVQKFTAQLATLVPGPHVSVPWRAEFALPAGGPSAVVGQGGTLVLSFPAEFASGTMGGYLASLVPNADVAGGADRPDVVVVEELPDTVLFGERAAVTEAARRTVELWAARTPGGAETPVSAALSHPWRRVGERRPQLMPAGALGAWRTLIDHLSDRRVVGEYAVTPGVKCYILADRGTPGASTGGALVAWNESAAAKNAVIRRFLGPGPIEVVDMFGNRRAVERSKEIGGPHEIVVGETPVFIEGADPMLASFCSGVKVEPSFLPAVQTEHELALVLTNPWSQTISGKLQVVSPRGLEGRRRWTITPDGITQFSIPAGQTKRIPWMLTFPAFEETGEKNFGVVVRLTTDRELPPIQLPMSFQVGLQDLGLDPDVTLGPRLDGPDVIIMATVMNKGARPRMLKLEAVAPGIPTQQTLISDLPGGEAVVKRIVFKDGAAALTGKRIRLTLTDGDEQERLNTSVRVP